MDMPDKTTLRIILAIAGALILLAIYLWDRWKRRRRKFHQFLESSLPDDYELEEIDTISINPVEDTLPPDPEVLETERLIEETELEAGEAGEEEEAEEPIEEPARVETTEPSPTDSPKEAELPAVIQISIMAPKGTEFQGRELLKAFNDLGLKYGDMEIFHLYQGDNILFSLASMVKPGTFPIERMEDFQTPGLTLFMQPPLTAAPLQAFERMVALCHTLAQRLGGKELDERRHPLTSVKLALWRRQLRSQQ